MSEMIEENNNDDAEIGSTSYSESESDYVSRKPRSRERGHDKKPRTYRINSMRNLTQFNERPQEFVQYLKDEKGVDISDYSKLTRNVWIVVGIMAFMVAVLYLYDWHQNKKDDDGEDANKISHQER